MSDLGTLPGDVDNFASGINNRGQVVGASFDQNQNPRAFIWQNGCLSLCRRNFFSAFPKRIGRNCYQIVALSSNRSIDGDSHFPVSSFS